MRGNIFASGFAGGGMAYIHCLKLLCLALVLFASVADAAMPKRKWVVNHSYGPQELRTSYYDSPALACQAIASYSNQYGGRNGFVTLVYASVTKTSENKARCDGYTKWNNGDTSEYEGYGWTTGVYLCPDGSQGSYGIECPEKCPDGSLKPADGECPNKCPEADTPGPQYPMSEPVGYKCEGNCVVEVSRASGEFPGAAGLPPFKYRQGYYTGQTCDKPEEPPEPKPDDNNTDNGGGDGGGQQSGREVFDFTGGAPSPRHYIRA